MKKILNYLVSLILIVSLVSYTITLVAAPPPTPEPGDYDITFLDVTYDEVANSSTWRYNVTCIGDPEISHFDFEFKLVCDPPLASIIDASPTPWEVVDPDPTTGVTGLKFDFGVPKGETVTVMFTLEGMWTVNNITVWVKAGHQDPYEGPSYIIGGPSCFVIPEVPFGTVATLMATLAAFGLLVKKKTFKM